MGDVAFTAPILEGKFEAWERFNAEIEGPRRGEWEDQMKRLGIERQRVWLQHTPMGQFVVVVVEGGDADHMMMKIGQSDNEFDVWFRGQIKDFHGIDMTQPPEGPPPTLLTEYNA